MHIMHTFNTKTDGDKRVRLNKLSLAMALGLPDMDPVTPALHKLNPNPLCNHLSFAPIFFSLYLHASFPPSPMIHSPSRTRRLSSWRRRLSIFRMP